jgi:hypothetical protein
MRLTKVALLSNRDTDENESPGKRVVPEQFLAARASSRAGDTYHSFRGERPAHASGLRRALVPGPVASGSGILLSA